LRVLHKVRPMRAQILGNTIPCSRGFIDMRIGGKKPWLFHHFLLKMRKTGRATVHLPNQGEIFSSATKLKFFCQQRLPASTLLSSRDLDKLSWVSPRELPAFPGCAIYTPISRRDRTMNSVVIFVLGILFVAA
jgi:hypothetical protein